MKRFAAARLVFKLFPVFFVFHFFSRDDEDMDLTTPGNAEPCIRLRRGVAPQVRMVKIGALRRTLRINVGCKP